MGTDKVDVQSIEGISNVQRERCPNRNRAVLVLMMMIQLLAVRGGQYKVRASLTILSGGGNQFLGVDSEPKYPTLPITFPRELDSGAACSK